MLCLLTLHYEKPTQVAQAMHTGNNSKLIDVRLSIHSTRRMPSIQITWRTRAISQMGHWPILFNKRAGSSVFPKLSQRFLLLHGLAIGIPRSKALDALSSGHWENIQKLCVQYDYERENEALEEGILNCIPGVQEVFISGVSLISFARICRSIGSLQAMAITVLSLRISFVTSIDSFNFTPLGVAVTALANLESLTLIGEPKLLVRTPFWSCDFAELAAMLSCEFTNS